MVCVLSELLRNDKMQRFGGLGFEVIYGFLEYSGNAA